jgi:hypothetical protein
MVKHAPPVRDFRYSAPGFTVFTVVQVMSSLRAFRLFVSFAVNSEFRPPVLRQSPGTM